MRLSIVIPAKNEAKSLNILLPEIIRLYPGAEVIVVNDGSKDNTSEVCVKYGVSELLNVYSKGNGSSIKAGARKASGDTLVFMDGDGQHNPEDIEALLSKMDEGYDMVVGSRSHSGQASVQRSIANTLYNKLATLVVGHKIEDLTSGFRVVRREKFLEYLYLLPNGFSYPTTITMAFFRAGYSVGYFPIDVARREGKSHINLVKDGIRFLLIIFKVGTLYSPLKVFIPISLITLLVGVSYYLYTYMTIGRFTNMSALFFTTSLMIFLMGLISEQITSLLYSRNKD